MDPMMNKLYVKTKGRIFFLVRVKYCRYMIVMSEMRIKNEKINRKMINLSVNCFSCPIPKILNDLSDVNEKFKIKLIKRLKT